MGHQPPAHLLIPFPLLKGVAGTVPVLKEGQAAAGKPLLYIIFDNSLLVFNGDILLIQFVVHRNTGVACNVKGFNHLSLASLSICSFLFIDNIVHLFSWICKHKIGRIQKKDADKQHPLLYVVSRSNVGCEMAFRFYLPKIKSFYFW